MTDSQNRQGAQQTGVANGAGGCIRWRFKSFTLARYSFITSFQLSHIVKPNFRADRCIRPAHLDNVPGNLTSSGTLFNGAGTAHL